jgi:hypothetical protein
VEVAHTSLGRRTENGDERRVNRSLKFLSKYLITVPKSTLTREYKNCDVHDLKDWVDVPKNTAEYHTLN